MNQHYRNGIPEVCQHPDRKLSWVAYTQETGEYVSGCIDCTSKIITYLVLDKLKHNYYNQNIRDFKEDL